MVLGDFLILSSWSKTILMQSEILSTNFFSTCSVFWLYVERVNLFTKLKHHRHVKYHIFSFPQHCSYLCISLLYIYLFILANVLAWRQHNNMLGSALPVLSKHRVSGLYHCSPKACLNRGLIQSFLSRPALGSVGSLSILYNAVVCRIYVSLLIFRTWTSELHSWIPRSGQVMCFSVNFCRFYFYTFFLWFGMGRKFYCSVLWVRRCLSIFYCKCPVCFPVARDSLCQAKFLYAETVLTA